MMEMSEDALEVLEDEAFDQGFKKGRETADYDWRLVAAQFKKLSEILEVAGDQTLLDAAEHLGAEMRSHREASRAQAGTIEALRAQVSDLQADVFHKEMNLVELRIRSDAQHANDQLRIKELLDEKKETT